MLRYRRPAQGLHYGLEAISVNVAGAGHNQVTSDHQALPYAREAEVLNLFRQARGRTT